jgi:hypothetical protein
VTPLWLRSLSGRPDGETLENLAPWHKDAHQTNHAAHHAMVPPPVTKATTVTDYREFNPGTKFLVFEWESKNTLRPEDPPAVRLEGTDWKKGKGGKAIWLGD